MIYCIDDDVFEMFFNDSNNYSEKTNIIIHKFLSIINSDDNLLMSFTPYIIKNQQRMLEINDDNVKLIISYLIKNYVEHQSIKNEVSYKIVINTKKNDWDGANKNLFITLEYIIEHNLRIEERPALLCENQTDCYFYKELSSKYVIKSGLTTELSLIPGGGHTTGKALFMAAKTNNNIVLTICDSDKHAPDGTFGSTSTEIRRNSEALLKEGVIHSCYHIIDVMEKENLISPSEYSAFLKEGGGVNINYFKKIEDDKRLSKYLKFYDFKKGISEKYYKHHSKYWCNLFSVYPISLDDPPKLGANCIKYLDENIDKISEVIQLDESSYLHNTRLEISMLIWSFGVSTKGNVML